MLFPVSYSGEKGCQELKVIRSSWFFWTILPHQRINLNFWTDPNLKYENSDCYGILDVLTYQYIDRNILEDSY